MFAQKRGTRVRLVLAGLLASWVGAGEAQALIDPLAWFLGTGSTADEANLTQLPEIAEIQRLLAQYPGNRRRYLTQLLLVSQDYEAHGDLPKAIVVMEELVTQSQGRYYPDMLRLGALWSLLGNYEEALRYYQSAEAVTPTVDARHGMFTALIQLEQWSEAVRVGRLLLKQDPDNYYTPLRMAPLYIQLEEYDAGIAAYESILAVFPHDEVALSGKAYTLLAKGEREAAQGVFQGILLTDPQSVLGQQGFDATRDVKYALSQYVTRIFYSPRAVRTNGLELNVAPSINYKDQFIFTPAFTYTDIAMGQFGSTSQNTVNLGLQTVLSRDFAFNFHTALMNNNHTANNSTKDGKMVFGEFQYLGKVFVGVGGAYSDYHSGRNLNVSQASLRVGYALTPWLRSETKGMFQSTNGPLAPTGRHFQRDTGSIEQKLSVTLPMVPGLTIAATGWWGKKQLPVEADGAQVWNLTDLLMGGYKADISYTLESGGTLFFQGGLVRAKTPDFNNNPGVPGIGYQQYMTTFGYSMPLSY